MARTETTIDDLKGFAAQFDEWSAAILDIVAMMEEINMPAVELHSQTVLGLHFPAIEKFVGQAVLDAKVQKTHFIRGTETRSATQRRYNQKRKLRDAEKRKPAP